ncbi:ABC transporter substrate-binding protein [Mycolicibacterium confluentis]|uniref:Putative aliphatic sulfonates-binding protein n=2 Tax=Mycolicibacterium confluentis TaxID=28047 RepID=A0A7I7Y5J8_9MYCO|nr:aliphatic sulfonate ABC transporter substrate-binding protein [Mycolicibacterium confluentis]MCV7322780.1 aliphatic sulfonate ABC transporter substrate-binding protein [Mycolicibacterium confluentis]ORV29695.1 ABC transporter substrate-binding protein [Mycolicibacterium confluentis]BBZ36312.1 ABC transporter substrate-binding protein [Mycolicibacterium confluentis]
MKATLRTSLVAMFASAAMILSGCVSGENKAPEAAGDGSAALEGQVLNIDFATYNPLSLIIKDQGWLEDQGVKVNWVQSAGSNKANEALRAGAIDVGSTAGSAALLARSNGSPIQVIGIYSQPEWAALVAPAGSDITSVEQLRGKNVAATKGTDPYFFLLQSLEANGLSAEDITVQNLQHADGWAALQNGSVDAWAGLDPIMAGAEQTGATLFYRDLDLNSFGFLNAREDFLAKKPELAQLVIDAYASAADWAAENPDQTAQILADTAGLDAAVAKKVILERSNLDVDQVPGATQIAVLEKIGPIFVDLGDVPNQQQVDDALASIVNDEFAKQADANRFG